MNLVDTSGWIEYFFERPNATFFSEAIENTDELLVSVICIYEVFKKILLTADETRALQVIAQMKQGHIVALTDDLCMKASKISIQHTLPMADSLIYATAQSLDAVVWTQDEHFRDLAGVKYTKAPRK